MKSEIQNDISSLKIKTVSESRPVQVTFASNIGRVQYEQESNTG
jgi:hypothetical protein